MHIYVHILTFMYTNTHILSISGHASTLFLVSFCNHHQYMYMHMCIYMCICAYTCAYIYKYICIYMYISIRIYAICIYIYMCMHILYIYGRSWWRIEAVLILVYVYIYMYICIYLNVYVYAYMQCAYTYTCIWICIYYSYCGSWLLYRGRTHAHFVYRIIIVCMEFIYLNVYISTNMHTKTRIYMYIYEHAS
jgi:hypothetical protein